MEVAAHKSNGIHEWKYIKIWKYIFQPQKRLNF